MLDLLEGRLEFAMKMLGDPGAEDLRELVGGETPEAQLAAALEDLVDREGALEDEVSAVLDLGDGIEAAQVHGLAFALGEFGAEDKGPILQPLPNDLGGKPVCGALKCFGVRGGEKGIVVLPKGDALPVQLVLYEGMTVQVVRGLEGEEGADAHGQRAKDLVSYVEVVVGKTAALLGKDAVIGVSGGVLRDAGTERRALLHAPED